MQTLKQLLVFISLLLFISACQQDLQQPVYQYTLNNPGEVGSRFPYLFKDNQNTLYMSWITNIEEEIYAVRYSTYKDELWTAPQTVRLATDFFVNWADFPSVVGVDGEASAVQWLQKVEGGTYAYHVQIGFQDDETGRWEQIVTPHLEESATEHGFVTMRPIDSDRILAIWLDGRNTEGRGHHEYEDISKSMTIRSAEISSSGEITRSQVIDQTVCDCCQTDMAEIDGDFLAVYRGRTADEIRDIMISRYSTADGSWSEPTRVHNDDWEIRACPVNGPRIAVSDNQVAVIWYTGTEESKGVKLAQSNDGGNSFEEPILIAGEGAVGRTDLLITNEGSTYVSWMHQEGETGYIMLQKINPDGTAEDAITVGLTSSSRTSGFPRIEQTGDHILVAWTQTRPLVRVRTARVPLFGTE
tara:strand:+ start:2250 stop:3491 length:1242 start_codon:yes stop_codon:yes gene_type:complete